MTAATLNRPQARPLNRRQARPQTRPLTRPQARVRLRTPAARRVRLTRRGRLVLLLVAAVLLLVAISVGRTGSQAATFTETGPAVQQITVQQGETLWSVAQRIAPGNDPRGVIAQIRHINHLQGSSLRVGQQLLLPTAG